MRITFAGAGDFARLTEIWEAAVRGSHDFLTEADILFYKGQVRDIYLAKVELLAARDDEQGILGFMGMSPPDRVEMLFVDPAHSGRGVGAALIRHALAKHGTLALDVNEQNPAAIRFYVNRGFIRTGRSPLDGQGRPFPLIHMRLSPTIKG